MEDLARLQHIQVLKFLGYSLQEIKHLLQEQSPSSEQFYASLKFQKQLITEKRDELNRALDAIDDVQALLDQGQPLTWTVLSPLLHNMQHEEEHKEWMKEHFPEEFVQEVYNLSTEERRTLNAEWLNLLSKIKKLVQNEVSPQSPEAKEVLVQMTDLVFRNVKQDENFFKQLEENKEVHEAEMNDFRFPNFFTPEEEAFLQQIAEAMQLDSDAPDTDATR
jgi:DNA-binding transcriptional MerR regulator